MPKVKFHPREQLAEDIISPPVPSSKCIPDWFKKLEGVIDKNKPHRFPNNRANKTIKMCVPVIDALTAGYMITLPCDVAFVNPDEYNGQRIIWDVSWRVAEYHAPEQLRGMPLYEKYEEIPWKWNVPWSIQTPAGYSLLFTHPLNRMELPFTTMSGVVDTDDVTLILKAFIKPSGESISPETEAPPFNSALIPLLSFRIRSGSPTEKI
jgi:hypothetical protein